MINYPDGPELISDLIKHKDEYIKLKSENNVLLGRYDQIINSDFIQDISVPHYITNVPKLVPLLNSTKVKLATTLIDASQKNSTAEWDKAGEEALRVITFSYKYFKGARSSINQMVASAIMREGINYLNNINS